MASLTGDDLTAHPGRWKALAVLCLAVLIVTLDNTILNVALPTLARELDASTSQLQWIVEAFVLALAALLLTAGALGDRLGRRRLLVAGSVVFGVGSILAAVCTTAGELIAARALLGLGAAGIMPATLSSIRSIFAGAERGRAIGIWTAASSLGIVLGPIIGGALIEWFSWPAIFLVNVPVVVIVLLASRSLPETRAEIRPRLDLAGAGLSAAGILVLVFAIIEAPHAGWTSVQTLGLGLAAAVTLAVFVAWERRTADPLIDLSLLKVPQFSVASLSVALIYLAFGGVLFAITQYFQVVLGYGALEAGVRLAPLVLGFLAAAAFAGRVVARIGSRRSIAGGLLVVAVGFGLLSTVEVASSYWLIAAALFVLGAGTGLAAPAATESVMSATPAERAGSGAALDETAVELGQALGVAILGSVLASGYASSLRAAADVPAGGLSEAVESVGAAGGVAERLGGQAGLALLDAARAAFVEGMADTALAGAAICVVAAVMAFTLLPKRPRVDASAAVSEPADRRGAA